MLHYKLPSTQVMTHRFVATTCFEPVNVYYLINVLLTVLH